MKNGTIILVPYQPNVDKGIYKVIGWVIGKVTGEPYTHTAIYFNGQYFDDTIDFVGLKAKSGVRELSSPAYTIGKVLEYKSELTPDQYVKMQSFLVFYANTPSLKYSILRLFAFAVLYPTRWLWDKVGWMPFQNATLRQVCSTFCSMCYKFAGIDLFKGSELAEMIVPGDFLKSPLLQEVEQ